jgi:hypothetical protein
LWNGSQRNSKVSLTFDAFRNGPSCNFSFQYGGGALAFVSLFLPSDFGVCSSKENVFFSQLSSNEFVILSDIYLRLFVVDVADNM